MAQIDVISFEQIATMLSQLATNYSELFSDYYNLFYNPEPMDITVGIYDKNGNLEEITIPNRAKDREYFLNGRGNPEGEVEAEIGSIYQDLDNGLAYIKQFITSDSTGWSELMTIGSLSEYLLQDVGSPEGVVTAAKGVLYVDRGNANLYIKTTNIGSTGWNLISASTENLADRNLNNLLPDGLNKFLNRSIGNLDSVGQAKWDGKENNNNKKSEWTNNINNTYYPTTKLVYDEINNKTNVLADRDLSNLNQEGEGHFVRTLNQVRDCIFKAPNGLPSVSGNIISLPQGTTLLCTNGVDSNRASVNEKVTTTTALSVSISVGSNSVSGAVFFSPNLNVLAWYGLGDYYRQNATPSPTGANAIWYNPDDNTYKVTEDSGSTWTTIRATEIGRFTTNSSGTVDNFYPYHPLSAAMKDDIKSLSVEINNVESELNSAVSTINTALNGKANTSLDNISPTQTVKNSMSGWSDPDYSNGVSIASLPYSVTKPGYVYITVNGYDHDWTVTVNNKKIGLSNGYSGGQAVRNGVVFRVSKGDTIRNGSPYGGFREGMFFPMKGTT